MGEPAVTSVRSRWLIMAVIVIIAALGLAITFWTGILFPRKVEKIYFSSCQWSGDVTEANLYIANTGADELIINKVWINGTLLDSTEWESFPSMRFQPGDQGVLHITPSSIVFKEGITYQFIIETVAGNSFSHTDIAESQTFPFLKTEELKITRLTWSTDTAPYDNATLAVKNTGSGALLINAAVVNDGSATMTPSSVTLQPGDTSNIVVEITNDFVSGTKYTFVLKSATGNKYQYVATAP